MTKRVEALVNPQVLAWARRMAGMDEELAARKVGVKPERIRGWERGELRPTITQLRKLSDVYKRPLSLFFLETLPVDDPSPTDFRRFDPTATEPLSPELRFQIRDARTRREAALELFEDIEEEPPQFTLTARLSDDPETVAERLRQVLLADAQPPLGDPRVVFNFWRDAAERAGVLVFQAVDVALEEMRGFSITDHPLPAVVLNIKDAYQARSFSLFHELAHVLL
ncbi:MAG: helix-turn-helix domain-containing protein, partial [Planctomycetota bacterium]